MGIRFFSLERKIIFRELAAIFSGGLGSVNSNICDLEQIFRALHLLGFRCDPDTDTPLPGAASNLDFEFRYFFLG